MSVAEQANVQGEGPLNLSEETLPASVSELEASIRGTFGRGAVARQARLMTDAAIVVGVDPSPANELRFVSRLGALADRLQTAAERFAGARLWRLWVDLQEFLEGVASFCGEGEWEPLTDTLAALPPVAVCLDQFRKTLRFGFPSEYRKNASVLRWKAGTPVSGKRLVGIEQLATGFLAGQEEAQLAQSLHELRHALEARGREAWLLCRQEPYSEATVLDAYAWAWRDLLCSIGGELSPGAVIHAIGNCTQTAHGAGLPEVARFLENREFATGYALNYLLPPIPSDWRLDSAARLQAMLDGQISRCHLCHFHQPMTPLEMIGAVLNGKRPLDYERLVGNALVQYGIIQRFLRPGDVPGGYFELLQRLEDNFLLLLDGYLLRVASIARLKTPADWKRYLGDMVVLHSGSMPAELAEYKRDFLSERGLASGTELLSGCSGTKASVN